IARRRRPAGDAQRRDREEELPPPALGAARAEPGEFEVVEELQAQRDEEEDMDRLARLAAAREGVAHAVTAQERDPAVVQPRSAGVAEAGQALARVPGTVRGAAPIAASEDEERVALADARALRRLGGVELARLDRRPRLQPLDAAQAWDVEKDAARHDAVLPDREGVRRRPRREDRAGGPAGVELSAPDERASGRA